MISATNSTAELSARYMEALRDWHAPADHMRAIFEEAKAFQDGPDFDVDWWLAAAEAAGRQVRVLLGNGQVILYRSETGIDRSRDPMPLLTEAARDKVQQRIIELGRAEDLPAPGDETG